MGFKSHLHYKINWCFSLIIKNNYYKVDVISKNIYGISEQKSKTDSFGLYAS